MQSVGGVHDAVWCRICICGEGGNFCVALRFVVFGRLVSLSAVCAFPMNAVCEACNQYTTARTRTCVTCHVAMASGFMCAHKVSGVGFSRVPRAHRSIQVLNQIMCTDFFGIRPANVKPKHPRKSGCCLFAELQQFVAFQFTRQQQYLHG